MPQYKAGVVGPIPLEDGRIVTDVELFELTITSPHDQALVDEGTIVQVTQPTSTPAGKSAGSEPASGQKGTE